jgi:Destabilase
MAKYAVDCNQDGNIDCDDYKHIQQFGLVDCKRRNAEEETMEHREEQIKEQFKEQIKDPYVDSVMADY